MIILKESTLHRAFIWMGIVTSLLIGLIFVLCFEVFGLWEMLADCRASATGVSASLAVCERTNAWFGKNVRELFQLEDSEKK